MDNLQEKLIAARRGDSDAWEAVVRRYQDMAVGYAFALLGNWQEAEDAAQEAFITAFYALIKLRRLEAFPGWLRRIVHSRACRRTRRDEPTIVSLEQAGDIAAVEAPRPMHCRRRCPTPSTPCRKANEPRCCCII